MSWICLYDFTHFKQFYVLSQLQCCGRLPVIYVMEYVGIVWIHNIWQKW